MKTAHPLRLPVILLIVSLIGFIGLFVLEGVWDLAFFLLSVLPLAVGAAAWWRQRPAGAN